MHAFATTANLLDSVMTKTRESVRRRKMVCFGSGVKHTWARCLLLAGLLPAIACTTPAQAPSQKAMVDLGGSSWQFVRFQSGDDRLLIPDDRGKYTIAFGTDGSLSARI